MLWQQLRRLQRSCCRSNPRTQSYLTQVCESPFRLWSSRVLPAWRDLGEHVVVRRSESVSLPDVNPGEWLSRSGRMRPSSLFLHLGSLFPSFSCVRKSIYWSSQINPLQQSLRSSCPRVFFSQFSVYQYVKTCINVSLTCKLRKNLYITFYDVRNINLYYKHE